MSEDGTPLWKTAHSTNPVPLYIADHADTQWQPVEGLEAPGLSNLAATLLVLLGLEVPTEYRPSLVQPA